MRARAAAVARRLPRLGGGQGLTLPYKLLIAAAVSISFWVVSFGLVQASARGGQHRGSVPARRA